LDEIFGCGGITAALRKLFPSFPNILSQRLSALLGQAALDDNE
jgi:hypothetical protein